MALLAKTKNAILEVVTMGKGVCRSVDGQTFRVSPAIRWLMDENKEPQLRAFMRERVRENDVLLDVGAHAGYYVLLFSRWAPRGRVIAFEPNPATRRLLQRNIRLNGLSERVIVEPSAVADQSAEMDFFMRSGEGRSRLQHVVHEDVTELARVSTVTLDDYLATQQLIPTWLLIDIEGFEIAALRGAHSFIEARRNLLTIVVEMHPNVWARSGTNRADAMQLFEDLRLEVIPLTGQSDPLGDYGIVHLAYRN